MTTESALRARMRKVLDYGVTQRALAERLGVSESWLSRWLDPKPNVSVRPISVPEMDRFDAYARSFAAVLVPEQESQRGTPTPSAPTAGRTFHRDKGKPPRKTG